jgi:hypothetical protein
MGRLRQGAGMISMRMWRRCVILLMMAGGFPSGLLMAQSRNFYVSPAGSDLNTGLSLASPLKTIGRGIGVASAGDTIYLLPGTYREMVKILQRKGIAEQPLCIYGFYQSPELRPVIDGGAVTPSNTNTTNTWLDIENSDWIEVGNVEFRNGWTNPIQVLNSSYLTFNGCIFYGGKKVIAATGANTHHVLVQNCFWDQGGDYLWRLVTDPAAADAWTSMHEGAMQYYNGSLIDFSGTGGSIVIRNNSVTNAFNGIRWVGQQNYDTNIEIYDNTITNIRDNDFEPEYFTFNLHIYHNRSHNIHKTMSVDHVQGGSIYYYGNRITSDNDSWSNSISTSFWKVYGAGSSNLTFPLYVFNNSFCGVGKVFSMDAGTTAAQLKHFNNAYYITGSRTWMLDSVDSTDAFDFDISNKTWPLNISNRGQEKSGVVDDVQYVSSKSFDLRLKSTSPAIDRGTTMYLPEFGWKQAFQGSAPDIGAYEGGDLQEGPPFRFRTLPGMRVAYSEKPRIVRSHLTGNTLSLNFSMALDPSTVSTTAILLSQSGTPLRAAGVSLAEDNFRMNIEIEPGRALDERAITVAFNPLPKGMNGETATLWAAALGTYKKSITTEVSGSRLHPDTKPTLNFDVYPNPLNARSRVLVRIPASLEGGESGIIRIYDVLGRMLDEKRFSPFRDGPEVSLNTDRLATGTYFAVLRIGDQTVSKKFVVLR